MHLLLSARLLLVGLIFRESGCKLTPASPMPPYVATSYNTTELKAGVSPRRNLSLMAVINFSGPLQLGLLCTEPMRFALEAIERMPNLLPNYKLKIALLDDATLAFKGVQVGTTWLREVEGGHVSDNFLPIMLGNYGFLTFGQYIQFYNFILINYYQVVHSSRALDLNRDQYPTTFFIFMVHDFVYPSLVATMEKLGWKKLAILATQSYTTARWDYILMNEMLKRNMTLLGISKIKIFLGQTIPLPSEIEAAVADLAEIKDARIFVLHLGATIDTACFLYKYKLYGAGYVILIPAFSSFHKDAPKSFSWCTTEMLSKVLESVVYFGPVPNSEILGEKVTSSAGVTSADLDKVLRASIESPESYDKWSLRTTCFDTVLIAAYLLNATEQVLVSERNESLVDWVVEGKKFRENGSTIMKILNETMYHIELEGLSSKYKFDKKTGFNWAGYSPVTLMQMQTTARYENGTAATMAAVSAVLINMSDFSMTYGPGKFVWRTTDGQAPRDSMLVITVKEPPDFYGYIAVTVLACLVAVASCSSLIRSSLVRKCGEAIGDIQNFTERMNACMAIGDIALACHVFLLPLDVPATIAQYCMAAYFILIFGFSLTISTHVAKLMLSFAAIRSLRAGRNFSIVNDGLNFKLVRRTRRSGRSRTATVAPNQNNSRAHSRADNNNGEVVQIGPEMFLIGYVVVASWLFVNCLLVTFWFGFDPLRSVLKETKLVPSENDISLSYQFYIYKCVLSSGRLNRTNRLSTYEVLLGIICAANGLMIVIGFGLAQLLRSERSLITADVRQSIISINASTISIGAGIAVALIFVDNWAILRIVISLTALAIACCNLLIVLFRKQ